MIRPPLFGIRASGRARAISEVASVSAASSGVASTAAINTTGASLLVAMISYYVGDPVELTDSKGNTWVPLTAYSVGDAEGRLYYCKNPSVGAGHTFQV